MSSFLLFLFSLLAAETGTGAPSLALPSVFSDSMVLQREIPVRIFGSAVPEAAVTVRFAGQEVSTTAGTDGGWELYLDPLEASFEPGELVVESAGETVTIRDVLVGEVWLCSGQSNMEWPVRESINADLALLPDRYPAIRLLLIPRRVATEPVPNSGATWTQSDRESLADFSAVGFHFGKILRESIDVPVGLIGSSYGGTPAIAWTRPSAFDRHPLLKKAGAAWEHYVESYPALYEEWKSDVATWLRRNGIVVTHVDPGKVSYADQLAAGEDGDWWEPLPSFEALVQHFNKVDGAVWLRHKVELPPELRGRDLGLSLGTIDDFDEAFIDGIRIGGLSMEDGSPWQTPREYTIPGVLTNRPEIMITVRIFDHLQAGGITNNANLVGISEPETGVRIPLQDGWDWHPSIILEPATGGDFRQNKDFPKEPQSPMSPQRPGGLANGMIAPAAGFTIRGVIWYQGESDAGWEPDAYGERLKVMIEDWREWWNQPGMPFGIVQLAAFRSPGSNPSDEPWSRIRESQRQLVNRLSNTGLAVTIDVGEANDIHPRDKETVGRRLARWALTDVYGKLKVRGGPEFVSARIDGSEMVLTFRHFGRGLHIFDDNNLEGFTIAGNDRIFYPAQAKIRGRNDIVVSSSEVPEPVAVRYAWRNHPRGANLTNRDRLPASPFRTDDWPLDQD